MRASGGVCLTQTQRLSSTVRSVAVMLAGVNIPTLALRCVSWMPARRAQTFFFFFTEIDSRLRGRVSIKVCSWGGTTSDYNGETMTCKKENLEYSYFSLCFIHPVSLCGLQGFLHDLPDLHMCWLRYFI